MIRYLDNQEKSLTKDLWREAFPEDSEDFLDYYDQEKMSRNQVLVRGGGWCYPVDASPESLPAAGAKSLLECGLYCGGSHRSDMRHRGYMRSLLIRMMTDMRAQQMPFCFLMPAAEAIYTPFQFAFIYDQPVWKLKENAELERISIEETGAAEECVDADAQQKTVQQIADWMQHWLEQRYEVFAKRDDAYVTSLLREVKSELGSLDLLYDQKQLVGVQSIWGREEKKTAPFVYRRWIF